MHVCFLCHEYPPSSHGGVGSFTQTLGRTLVQRGYRVSSIGLYPPGHEGHQVDEGVDVVRVTRTKIPKTGFVINASRLRNALWKLHAKSPIDILEGPELSQAFVPRDFPARKVIRMNGGHHYFASTLGKSPGRWRARLEKRSFAKADSLCAVSRYVADTTSRLLGLSSRPIEVLPNPVDVQAFRPRPDIPEEEGVLFFAGTVQEKKGIRQLVLAMPAIVDAVPHAKLLVAGRDRIDPESNRSFTEVLRTLVPPAIQNRIEFLGGVEHFKVGEYIARAQVCIYPSHMEAMGIAWLEGLASGKAVVGSHIGPGPEVIEDGVSGLLCHPHSPKSIADCVIRLLKDDLLRRSIAAEARRRALASFSVDVLVDRNQSFYENCIRGRNRQ